MLNINPSPASAIAFSPGIIALTPINLNAEAG
jgi:hypothetical protein